MLYVDIIREARGALTYVLQMNDDNDEDDSDDDDDDDDDDDGEDDDDYKGDNDLGSLLVGHS